MSTTPNKTLQTETHPEQEKRIAMANRAEAAKQGQLPNNADITSGINKAQAGINKNNDQLSATGQVVTEDIAQILETTKKMVNQKNDGDLMQKAYYHSHQAGDKKSFSERINHLRATSTGSGDKAQVRAEARQNVNSMATIIKLAFLSPEFRETINDVAQISSQLLKNQEEKKTATGASGPAVGVPAGKDPVNKAKVMTREEKEDKLIDRLVDLAQTLHSNPEYRNSIEYMSQSASKLKGKAQEKKGEAKAIRQQDKMKEPTSEIEHHKKEVQMNTKQFAENWIGDNYSLDRLLDQVHLLYQSSQNDPELRSLLQDWKTWATQSVKNEAYVNDKERVRRDIKDLVNRTRALSKGKYKDQIATIRREVIYINKAIQRDDSVEQLRRDMSKLGRDLVQDQNGKPVLKPELLADVQKILAGVLESINNIPLPPIHKNDADMEIQLENIVLTATNIMPSNIRVIAQMDAEETGPTGSRQHGNSFIIELSKIEAHLTSVNFFVDKKTGFPKITERGLADIDLSGKQGLSLRIEVAPKVQTTGKQVHSVFEAKDVTCSISKLKIHLRETKHDFLYKLVSPVVNMMAKKKIEVGVQDAIRNGFAKMNDAAASNTTTAVNKADQQAKQSDKVRT